MASFLEMFTTFSLIGLMVFGGILFVTNLQNENNLNITILNDTIINSTFIDLNNSLGAFSDSASGGKDAFEEDKPASGFVDLVLFAVIGVVTTFTGLILGVWNVLIVLPASLLGVPSVVIGVLGALLMVTLILSAWRLYKAGA